MSYQDARVPRYHPKLKMFSWRTITECLPLKARLARYISDISGACPFCQCSDETAIHIFFNCSVTSQIWSQVNLPTVHNTNDVSISLIQIWWTNYKQAAVKGREAYYFCVLWGIWHWRNKLVFQNIYDAVSTVIRHINGVHRLSVADSSSKGPEIIQELMWSRPEPGKFFLNVDASFTNNMATTGLILRDASGVPCFVAAYKIVADCPLAAELRSILKGLEWITKEGKHNVTVQTDCLKAVTLLSEIDNQSPWQQLLLVRSCRSILMIHPDINIVHIRREANKVAHLLAQACRMDEVEFEDKDYIRVCNNIVLEQIKIEALM